jgi:hypothetical protein
MTSASIVLSLLRYHAAGLAMAFEVSGGIFAPLNLAAG